MRLPFHFPPVEDLLLPLLNPLSDKVPGCVVASQIQSGVRLPLILVRHIAGLGNGIATATNTDVRFERISAVTVETFTANPNGDEKGETLQWLAIRQLFQSIGQTVPGLGYLSNVRIAINPHRETDWQSSTGAVQYASLPKGCHRYESTLGVRYRPDTDTPYDPYSIFR